MRILCLHGYLQSAEIMKSKMTKYFNTKHSVQFLEGCYDCGESNSEHEGKKGWWFLDRNNLFTRDYDFGTKFLEYIKTNVTEEPDFIIGFSQGCLLATILVDLNIYPSLKGVILIGGSPITDPKYVPKQKLTIPSLHVVGNNDPICEPKHAQMMMEYYMNPEVHVHPGQHVIPTKSPETSRVKNFMERLMK